MSELFQSMDLPITCPNCRRKFSKRFREPYRNATVSCPRCRTKISVNLDGPRATLRKMRVKAREQLRGITKTIKIKL